MGNTTLSVAIAGSLTASDRFDSNNDADLRQFIHDVLRRMPLQSVTVSIEGSTS